MTRSTIDIRPLKTIDAFFAAEETQQRIWGMAESVLVPVHVLVTAQKNGGLVLGAFDGEEMIGYLFGFLGRTDDGVVKHCSHMMGVVPEYRGQGIGRALKRRQRAFVLEQGLDLITWTYDPLEAVNAYLNITKLGAICHRYLRNVYGELRDELNRGVPTDRFEVEWWIRMDRVTSRMTAAPSPRTRAEVLAAGGQVATDVQVDARGILIITGWRQLDAPIVLAQLPGSFQRIKSDAMEAAQQWRLTTRALFEFYFAAGYSVVDVIPPTEEDRWYYVLEALSDTN